MDWLLILTQILEVCIIPLLGIATTFLVKFLKAKADDIVIKNENDVLDKYVEMLADTITECVIATNQTYVESLKATNAFTAEAQKEAFNLTYNAVMTILSDDAKEYLSVIYGDLNAYITNQIEATVNTCK